MAHHQSVAVIGAGAAGLCAGGHLISEPNQFQFDIYERQDDVGGTWRYSTDIGQDQYGLPVHSSMYKSLMTITPKEVMGYPGFPFEECEGRSFPHHIEVLKYLQDYAKHFNLYENIKFHTLIENIRPLKQEDGSVEWAVSFKDLVTKEKETYIYDAVMLCNGHYSFPYMPEIKGLNNFKGRVIHSHDYREPQDFKDLKVVVLGACASGMDIGIEVSKVAKEVIFSHNMTPQTCPLPENSWQEKGIESVGESSVTFIGGKKYECDAILLCTGYLYHYPFLDPSCNVKIGDQHVSPLYLHMFHIEYPTLGIWAIPRLIMAFPIYDQQVKVFLKFLKGQIQLPSPEEMRAEMEKDFTRRLKAGFKPRHAHLMPGEWQWEFDDALSKLGKIDPLPPVVRNLFRHVHQLKRLDVARYKDSKFILIDNETFKQVE